MKTDRGVEGTRLEETRRVARVLDLIQQIAIAPHRWRRRELADQYEVSERQIQKDLEIVRHRLLLSLCHDQDGYYFERIPHLPTVTYTFSEALALLLAARTAQAMPGVNSAELAAAVGRLESLFPSNLTALLRQVSERLPRAASAPHRQEMLALLHRALIEGRKVHIEYATASRGGDVSERVIEPYHIMPYVRSWQVIAWDSRRQAVIEFKLDRIRHAELLDETYAISPGFDLDAYLGDWWGLMRTPGEVEEVELLFDPQAGRWVMEEQWHHSQQSEVLPDGRVQMKFRIVITPEFVDWVLYYGSRVRVVKPESLRDQVVEKARKMVELYANANEAKGE
jgi:predicted DNA-binding transcriptional regulator YafY